MCGIAGIVNLRGNAVEPAEISRLTSLVAHRGPFGEGSWFSANRNLAFGHRRLAIIDPGDGGYQPMVSADGRHVIVFNGEIYNFLELRRELEAQGAVFRSQSDTEVILAAWRAWQEGMLTRFNGMWALAIFDTQTEELFLARDRFGIKPLLYALTSERFVFASEQRALVRSGLINVSLDIDVARRLMLDAFGVEGSERTLCREVRRLQGGHCMWLRRGRVEIRRWWRTVEHLPAIPNTEAERVERFRELFQDAVALRMRSDVPIGTCLSGGFDSSAVICTMAAHEKAGMGPRDSTSWRHAFVATFPGASNDERPMAEEAAAWADVAPTFLEIGRADALTELDRILDDNDDVYIGLPSAAWLIYRELRRQNVTVSLDGHGADELMGAYLQDGQSGAFRLRNAVAGLASRSALARRGTDLLRALMIKRQGHYFLRGGLRDVPAAASAGRRRRRAAARLGLIEPAALSNVSQHRAADHPAKLRSPVDGSRHRGPDAVHGLASGDLYDGVAGNQQVIERLYQGHCAAGDGQPDAGIHSHGTPEGWIQFADAGMVERASRRLDCQSARSEGAGVRRTGGRGRLAQDRQPPDLVEAMGLGDGRPDLAVSEYEMDAGKVCVSDAPVSK